MIKLSKYYDDDIDDDNNNNNAVNRSIQFRSRMYASLLFILFTVNEI